MDQLGFLTAEQFAEKKFDLPDGGRWVELVDGEVVTLQPPDVAHGTTVLNLSKALANCLQQDSEGYACFELGLIVARNPDTVRCPSVSYFIEGDRFAEADSTVTETKPALVVEVPSTNDRRRDLGRRVKTYLQWGVELVWVIDPVDKEVFVYQRGRPSKQLGEHQMLYGCSLKGNSVLPEFKIRISDLFAEPEWWHG